MCRFPPKNGRKLPGSVTTFKRHSNGRESSGRSRTLPPELWGSTLSAALPTGTPQITMLFSHRFLCNVHKSGPLYVFTARRYTVLQGPDCQLRSCRLNVATEPGGFRPFWGGNRHIFATWTVAHRCVVCKPHLLEILGQMKQYFMSYAEPADPYATALVNVTQKPMGKKPSYLWGSGRESSGRRRTPQFWGYSTP